MAQAVHLHDRITSAATTTSASFETIHTVTAAELSAAGFSANDEVLVLWFFRTAHSASNSLRHSITYDGTELMWDATDPHVVVMGSAARERAFTFMERVDLGATIGDLVMRHSTAGGTGTTHHSEVFVVRLSDFGVENTDWFWDKETVSFGHSTTMAAGASVTFTPSIEENWVYFAQANIGVDSTTVSYEIQVFVDGSGQGANPQQEGFATAEEVSYMLFRERSLTAASHTIDVRSRDDTAVAANYHRQSRIFVFRSAVWSDLFSSYVGGPVSVPASGSPVVANSISDTLTGEQPLIMMTLGVLLQGSLASGFMWGEEGVTDLDPVSWALAASRTNDATDRPLLSWMGYDASASGTLDLNVLAAHLNSSARDLYVQEFIVWGMGVESSRGDSMMLLGAG